MEKRKCNLTLTRKIKLFILIFLMAVITQYLLTDYKNVYASTYIKCSEAMTGNGMIFQSGSMQYVDSSAYQIIVKRNMTNNGYQWMCYGFSEKPTLSEVNGTNTNPRIKITYKGNFYYSISDGQFNTSPYNSTDYTNFTSTDDNNIKSDVILWSNWVINEWDGKYTYEYSKDIPNVTDLKIQKHYLYKLGPVYIGLNKLKYDVSWTIPTDTGLIMEVEVMGKYNGYTRAYYDQTYNSPMYPDTNTYLLPTDGKYTFNIDSLAKELTEKAFSGVDVNVKNQPDYVTPSNIYYRYVKQDDLTHKIYYGNWTKTSITKLGATGIVDITVDEVTQTTTKDATTGETIYTDTPVDGNTTKHLEPNTGNEISEEESFNAVSDSMDNALNSGMSAMKSTADFAGEVPGMVTEVFGFLPTEVKTILALGVSLLVALRIWGR